MVSNREFRKLSEMRRHQCSPIVIIKTHSQICQKTKHSLRLNRLQISSRILLGPSIFHQYQHKTSSKATVNMKLLVPLILAGAARAMAMPQESTRDIDDFTDSVANSVVARDDSADAAARCVPGLWPTKAKCNRKCKGRGRCDYLPDSRPRTDWACTCPT